MPAHGVIIIEGHVQGLSNTRAFGEQQIPVIVVDTGNCIARYSKYCHAFYKCPPFNTHAFIEFIENLALKHKLKQWLLFPSNDHAVYNISVHKKRLSKTFKIITPAIEVIDNIYNKRNLINISIAHGIAVPQTYDNNALQNSEYANIQYPVITKGINGLNFYKTTGQKVFVSANYNELKNNLAFINAKIDLQNTYTQQLIPNIHTNKTISFVAFCIKGVIKTYWIGEKIREHPIRFGTATFAVSIKCKALIEPAKKLIEVLNYTGVCEIEYLLDPVDKHYKLIEINARTWLWVELAKACGVNFAMLAYNYVYNLPCNYPATYINNLAWINRITDMVYSLKSIIKRKLSVIAYLKSLRIRKVDAFFSWHDIKPSVMYLILLVNFYRKR